MYKLFIGGVCSPSHSPLLSSLLSPTLNLLSTMSVPTANLASFKIPSIVNEPMVIYAFHTFTLIHSYKEKSFNNKPSCHLCVNCARFVFIFFYFLTLTHILTPNAFILIIRNRMLLALLSVPPFRLP